MNEVTFTEFKWNPSDNEKFQSDKPSNSFQKLKKFEPPEESRVIYTDGGSRILTLDDGKKFYLGAWAFYDQETGDLIGRAEEKATNNQMELLANIRALEHLDEIGYPKDKWVTIRLDSDYVRLGMLFWIKKWILQNWVRITKEGSSEPVKNEDLWKRLNELTQGRKIYWEHVSGHSGEEGNEKVDIECGSKMDDYMEEHNLFKKK
mgnify:CR=1 FL=1